jgi:hypothetical protein
VGCESHLFCQLYIYQGCARIFSDATCTVLLVVKLVIACRDCRFIDMRLLYVNFRGYIE